MKTGRKRTSWLAAGQGLMLALMALALSGCEHRPPAAPLVLNDFESQDDLERIAWRCRTTFALSGVHRSHGRSGLLMTLYPDPYPGLVLILPPGMLDWRGYRSLALEVVNPGDEPLVLCYRIDDLKFPDYEDRVNGRFRLQPGENRLRLDLDRLRTSGTGRALNLKRIEGVHFFLVSPPRPAAIGIDHIRLEPALTLPSASPPVP